MNDCGVGVVMGPSLVYIDVSCSRQPEGQLDGVIYIISCLGIVQHIRFCEHFTDECWSTNADLKREYQSCGCGATGTPSSVQKGITELTTRQSSKNTVPLLGFC